jgi:hypothetical protein
MNDHFGDFDNHYDKFGNLHSTTVDMGNGVHNHQDAMGNFTGSDSHLGNVHNYHDAHGNLEYTTMHSPFRKKYLHMTDGEMHSSPSHMFDTHDAGLPHMPDMNAGMDMSGFHDFRTDLLNQIH